MMGDTICKIGLVATSVPVWDAVAMLRKKSLYFSVRRFVDPEMATRKANLVATNVRD